MLKRFCFKDNRLERVTVLLLECYLSAFKEHEQIIRHLSYFMGIVALRTVLKNLAGNFTGNKKDM